MIRARFKVKPDDSRPVNWPPKHPYWVTGEEVDGSYNAANVFIVAYADDEQEIRRNWPAAKDIDVHEPDAKSYAYTSRFPKPEWMP